MAQLAILASGGGSNFQAISEALYSSKHSVCCLICDRKAAYVIKRAKQLNIKVYYVSYFKREKLEAEQEIDFILNKEKCDIIALAGFMRLLSPYIIDRWKNKIINIHPALLPAHTGAHGIEDSFYSDDIEMGVTVHYVDKGTDTGPIIYQESFTRRENETIESAEKEIHDIEHRIYPNILVRKLDNLNKTLRRVD